jgi:hypothetical protein
MRRIKLEQVTILTVSDDTEIVDSPDDDGSRCLKKDGKYYSLMTFLSRSPGKVPPNGEVIWKEVEEEELDSIVYEIEEGEIMFAIESEDQGRFYP